MELSRDTDSSKNKSCFLFNKCIRRLQCNVSREGGRRSLFACTESSQCSWERKEQVDSSFLLWWRGKTSHWMRTERRIETSEGVKFMMQRDKRYKSEDDNKQMMKLH